MVSEIGYKKRILHNAINPTCQSVWIVMKVCSKIKKLAVDKGKEG